MFENLNSKDYWNLELQMELARESMTIADRETLEGIPYTFTPMSIYTNLRKILDGLLPEEEWDLSPDADGGIFAVYHGTDYDILTLELNNNFSLKVDYLSDGEIESRVFSFEVPDESKIYYINGIIKELV